jgi:hypothetical protein
VRTDMAVSLVVDVSGFDSQLAYIWGQRGEQTSPHDNP